MEQNPQNPDQSEKRAYRRFLKQIPVEYKLAATQDALNQASTLDLSGNGLKIRIKDKPSIGEEIHIAMDLEDRGKIVLAAKVIWFKHSLDEQGYDTGVKLAETQSDAGKIFMDYYTQQLLNFLNSQEDRGAIEG